MSTMTRETIAELAEKYRSTKDHTYRNEIVEANYSLIVQAAKNYLGNNLKDRGIKMENSDIIAEGGIGLMNAAEHFRLSENVKFSTFANKCIKTRIGRAIEEQSRIIRLSSNIQNHVREWKRVFRLLKNEFGRTPDNEEVSDWLIKNCKLKSQKWTSELAEEVVKTMTIKTSSSDEALKFIPIEEEQKSYEEEVQLEQTLEEIEALPEKQRNAVKLYFFEDLSMDLIAERLGVKKQKASYLVHSGIETIKDALGLDFNKDLTLNKNENDAKVFETEILNSKIVSKAKESVSSNSSSQTDVALTKKGRFPNELTSEERLIVYFNYRKNGGKLTFMELEEKFGLHLSQGNTAMRICKIVKKSLMKLSLELRKDIEND